MTTGLLADALSRRWKIAAVAMFSGLVVASFSHPEWGSHDYTATHVLYSPSAARAATTASSAPLVDPFAMKLDAVAALATSRETATRVASELGYDGEPLRLFRRVTARVNADAGTISITATQRNEPQVAVLVVDAVGRELIRLVDEARAADRKQAIDQTVARIAALRDEISKIDPTNPFTRTRRDEMIKEYVAQQAEQTRLEQSAATTGLSTVRPAVVRQISSRSVEALSPTVGWFFTLLLLTGLGMGLAIAVELTDARVSDSVAAAALTGLPVLAGLPSGQHSATPAVGRRGRVVLVTSPTDAEPTTETVVGLASAVADGGRTALIVDCDNVVPPPGSAGAVPRGIGDLANDARTPQSLSPLVQPTAIPRVSMVPRGGASADAAGFLTRHEHLVTSTKDLADVVIIHGPGVLEGPEAPRLARLSNETIVVLQAGETRAADARRAASVLYGAAHAVGVIVLDEPEPAPRTPLTVDGVRERVRTDARLRSRLEWAGAAVAMLVLYAFLRSFVMESYSIPTESMAPYLDPGDRVLVSKMSYRLHEVHRGDVVVFKAPRKAAAVGADRLIKRVIALPGETVESKDGKIYVNDQALDESYLPKATTTDNVARQKLPAGRYWMMGDNRGNSADSRFFGSITRDAIVGRAFFHLWPWPVGLM